DRQNGTTTVIANSAGGVSPAFSPDGATLAFAHPSGILVVPTSGQFAELPAIALAGDYAHPTYTPSGALVADHMNSIVSFQNGKLVEIVPNTTTTMEDPAVSPDGNQLAFTVFCGDGVTSVWAANLSSPIQACIDGVRQSQSLEGSSFHPSWGPNATLV